MIYDVRREFTGTHVGDSGTTNYYCSYRYVAEDGTTYRGNRGRYDTKKEAKHISVITIGSNGWHAASSKADIIINFEVRLIWAIIITIPTIIVLFIFIYYGIYRDILNRCLLTKGQARTGTVIKTAGFILKLVKVEYIDSKNIKIQKWTGFLFCLRDANYLNEMKNIRILVYKTKFGIDEDFELKKKGNT